MAKTSYKSLLTKDDKLFLEHAKKTFDKSSWEFILCEAADEFNKHTNPSTGKREANLVILSHLKSVGAEKWRIKEVDKKIEKRVIENATLPERRSGKKWDGKSILEMADDKLNKFK